MASAPVPGGRDNYDCSSKTKGPSRLGLPTETAGPRVGSSAQALTLDAPRLPLSLIRCLSFMRRRSLLPPNAAHFGADDIKRDACNACYPNASFVANGFQSGDADPCPPKARSAANGMHPGAVNPWPPTARFAANPRRPARVIRKLLMLVCSGRMTVQVCEERTLAPRLPPSSTAPYGLQQQALIAIPLMALISKIPHLWSCMKCWAMLSYLMAISGRGATIFRSLSNRFAEGHFTVRLCSYILGWLGYEGRQFVQVVEFMDLLSTLFRHASSTLKSVTDVLNKVNVFRPSNGAQSDILQESAPLPEESNEVPDVQQTIVSSLSEGVKVISRWKIDNAPISVDVPSTMSLKTAEELKRQFEREGANHLLNGPTINAILEKKIVSENPKPENATKQVEKLQGTSVPSSSSDGETHH